ncbi:DoxX family protein [Flavobacterium sp. CYK-55]|uniref:DoxX family membrane protein n=1 Tax=Flavobacterium sp. CYK-55 TaxID=2835529 RepID=UPI001BCADE0A|nr:DoxX family protein [Flavobacterium sp. CYK-55]MBS7786545.1 DoxX family protein [Flavobacterium sp. CYK-55]
MKTSSILWTLRLIPAVILLQTLFFKFTAAPESVYIFSTLGIEPYGRIGSGVFELISAILILWPRTTWLGALMGLATMFGAIFSHLFVLGVEVQNDGGLLFFLALVTALSCVVLLFLHRKQIEELLKHYGLFKN